ncbi:MAG: Cell division protein FtsQ [Verrucomicrobiae bacterium]|nr:Cell division protein FtsQ [Verrucomicrobiae bacterium]
MVRIGNRRKRRNEYLLDVKVQTEGRLRHRVRWLLAVTAVVAVAGLTGFGMYRLIKFSAAKLVYENPRFAVTEVIVENDGVLTPPQVMGAAGVAVGQNLLAVDLARVQRRLEELPVVRRVEVRRMLPAKLVIHVDERIAVARLQTVGSRDAAFFIDRNGVVMRPVQFRDGTVVKPQSVGVLPVLVGVPVTDLRVGSALQSEQVYRALELLDKVQQAAAGSMLEIEAIDLSKPRHLTLTTRQKTVVKFDMADFQPQLRRLSAILTWAAQRQKLVAAVDLTVSRGVPVQFLN